MHVNNYLLFNTAEDLAVCQYHFESLTSHSTSFYFGDAFCVTLLCVFYLYVVKISEYFPVQIYHCQIC